MGFFDAPRNKGKKGKKSKRSPSNVLAGLMPKGGIGLGGKGMFD